MFLWYIFRDFLTKTCSNNKESVCYIVLHLPRSLLGPCKLEIMAASCFKLSAAIYRSTWHHIPKTWTFVNIAVRTSDLAKTHLYHAVLVTVTLPSVFQDITVPTNVTKAYKFYLNFFQQSVHLWNLMINGL